MTVEEYFSSGPDFERPVFEAVRAHLDAVATSTGTEPPYVEPVSVGLFFKHGTRTFLQLRTRTRWVAVGFILHRRLDSDRLSRKVMGEGTRWYHVVNVRAPEEVDDQLGDWLAEAYLAADS